MIVTTEDKKKAYRAMTVAGKPMDRHVGEKFIIEDVVQFETTVNRKGDDGFEEEQKAVATSIFTTDGEMYTTISPTIDNCLQSMASVFGEMGVKGLEVQIVNGVSNNGRKFLQMNVL